MKEDPIFPHRERILNRVAALLEMLEEEGEDFTWDAGESFKFMMRFLADLPSARYPTITVTPRTLFRAEWEGPEGEHFSLEFLPHPAAHFVIMVPQERRREAGMVTLADPMNCVRSFGAQRWVLDEARKD